MDDLFEQELTQEEKWKKQLDETRKRFIERVEAGVKLRSNKQKRKALYQQWRKDYGDITARESAKYVEALLVGKVGWPKFYKQQ